jgi:hypothetical protein
LAPSYDLDRDRREREQEAYAEEEDTRLEDEGFKSRVGETEAETDLRKQRAEEGGTRRTRDLAPTAPARAWRFRVKTFGRCDSSGWEAAAIEDAFGREDVAVISDRDFHEDLSDRTATWLRDHDPRRTLAGVTREMDAAAVEAGITLDDCRLALPSSGGRPTADRQTLRAKVRDVLAPIYDDGRSRTLMAEVLCCSRPTLDRLMRR